jgi:hypothetical protein
MEKMIKVLLFTYGREVTNPFYTEGGNESETVVVEGLARLGEVVDVTRPYDLERGERAGAFFSDEERKAVENGTYNGIDSPTVYASRLQTAQAAIQPAEGEGSVDVNSMSSEELAEYIHEHDLNVKDTIALAGDADDIDTVNKVLDAESQAMQMKNADSRTGVTKALEAKLARATSG